MKHFCSSIGLTIILCLTSVVVWSQDTSPAADAPLEFMLHPVQEGFRAYVPGAERGTEIIFKKEPAYEGDTVRRNLLRIGDEPSDFIGVAYDVTGNKLYIDRNRNLDLTDDGPGIDAARVYDSDRGANFNNVVIEMVHDGVSVQYVMELEFYFHFFWAYVISGWEAEIDINGKLCTIGIADNLNGKFDSGMFRFDHERHREARLPYGSVDSLPLPQWMYFEGQSYWLSGVFRQQEDNAALKLVLTPITEDLMGITFDGPFVSRVTLADDINRKMAILDWPQPSMRIPDGSYRLTRVDLLDSFAGHYRYDTPAFLIGDGKTHLNVGAPLQQKVTVERRGARLYMNFDLRGADNLFYFPDQSYNNHAAFAVYRGNRKVGSGEFEYG